MIASIPDPLILMQSDIDRILVPRERIAARVGELAETITAELGSSPEVTIVPILTGAMIFAADLIRRLPMRLRTGLLAVSSYPGASVRSQGADLIAQQIGDIRGRHVLLIDDILDSGCTITLVRNLLLSLGPANLKTCVLLRKNRPQARSVHVDYVGFDIPDEFVVGYGLDYDDYYRNLPDIVTLKRHIIANGK